MVTRRELLVGTLAAAPRLAVARRALAQPEGRPKRLLFVHGRSQQARHAALLRSEWIASLREGARKLGRALPSDVEIVLPYYLEVLDRFVAQAKIPLGSQMQTRRTIEQQEFFAFQASIAEQLRSKAHITDDQVNAEYGTNRMPKGPLNWWWIQAMLRALDQYGPGMTKNTIETFTRDVFLYATRAELRDEIDR